MSSQLILFVHGSQSLSAQSYYQKLLDRMSAKFSAERVRLAHLQFLQPDLDSVIRKSVIEGVTEFVILPLFLAPGNHIEIDLPNELATLRKAFPEIEIKVLKPVGEDERFLSGVVDIAEEGLA